MQVGDFFDDAANLRAVEGELRRRIVIWVRGQQTPTGVENVPSSELGVLGLESACDRLLTRLAAATARVCDAHIALCSTGRIPECLVPHLLRHAFAPPPENIVRIGRLTHHLKHTSDQLKLVIQQKGAFSGVRAVEFSCMNWTPHIDLAIVRRFFENFPFLRSVSLSDVHVASLPWLVDVLSVLPNLQTLHFDDDCRVRADTDPASAKDFTGLVAGDVRRDLEAALAAVHPACTLVVESETP